MLLPSRFQKTNWSPQVPEKLRFVLGGSAESPPRRQKQLAAVSHLPAGPAVEYKPVLVEAVVGFSINLSDQLESLRQFVPEGKAVGPLFLTLLSHEEPHFRIE